MRDAQQASDVSTYDKFIHSVSAQPQSWAHVRDHHGRTVLHAAVENGHMSLVKTLVSTGVDVNVKERCGASPLTLETLSSFVVDEDDNDRKSYFTFSSQCACLKFRFRFCGIVEDGKCQCFSLW